MYKTGAVVAVVVAVFIAMLSMLQEQEGHAAASIPLPGTLVPILGGWARDPRRVNAARKAIRGGRAVVIQGAFNTSLASAMRNELAAMQWGRDDRSTSAADLPAPSLFLNAPIAPEFREKSACLSIMARTEGRPFFFSHQQLLSEGATAQWPSDSATLRFSEALLSSELRDWVETTLFDGSELGDTGTAVRLMTPGDMYGPHTDATDHPAGLSMSAYFGSPTWQKEFGGRFVWCTNSLNGNFGGAEYVLPSFNTAILFRVAADTVHFVEPVAAGAPRDRFSWQAWWNQAGSDGTQQTSDRAHTSASGKQDRSILVI